MLHKDYETKNALKVVDAFSNIAKLNQINLDDVDPTARDVIQRILTTLTSVTSDFKIVNDALIDILKQIDYKLLDENGKFKKVGILNWKNISNYVNFAQFVKDEIMDLKEAFSNNQSPNDPSFNVPK